MNTIRFCANGTPYSLGRRPAVVVCIDGGDASYLQAGWSSGRLPVFRRFFETGFYTLARGTVPSFTCPNNMSIITGVPASVHGISGNFYLDRHSGQAVAMTGPELLRAQTILSACADAGGRVACVTAKDKLRLQLQKGLAFGDGRHVSLSVEKAALCNMSENGIESVLDVLQCGQADMYSAELSLQVLRIGLHLLKQARFDLLFLSLSDYVQHKHAPGEAAAQQFYDAMDDLIGQMDALGVDIALCADHGMSDKTGSDGNPCVMFVQDELDAQFGMGCTRVICPITDAFVKHHGALGGFVRIWLAEKSPTAEEVIQFLQTRPAVALALTREQACSLFSLPEDREADVVLVATRQYALGASCADHDLSGLAGQRLRTHGGVSESFIPVLLNRKPLGGWFDRVAKRGLDSYEVFDLLLNGLENGTL